MTRWLVLTLLATCALALPARAHFVPTALLVLEEQAEPGRFVVRFTPSTTMKRSVAAVRFVYPAHCSERDGVLQCGERGLVGALRATPLQRTDELIVRIRHAHGDLTTHVLSQAAPSVQLEPAAEAGSVAATYLRIGVEHILLGLDHLLFVLGLVLLVGFRRELVWTISAFTLAHSVTLAAQVLGVLRVRQAPVEALIALSIVLVALEALGAEPSLTRRHPSWIAGGFGLLHGLGFASALREVGLPEGELPLALLAFNVGVELGQLALLATLFVLARVVRRVRPALGPVPLAYAIGSFGVYWFVSRVSEMWS